MLEILTNLSKYRQTLMGVAILGVMIGHCKSDWPVTIESKILGLLCYSVFTGGFLFLSGFGLYFSLKRNPNIKDFYVKRVYRLLLPWLCISIPYFGYIDLIINHSLEHFFWHITTLAFWKEGNFSGMWYISVIVLLYCIYPLYHKLIFNSKHKFSYSLSAIILLILITEYTISAINPSYYDKIKVCMNLSIFFIGAEIASISVNSKKTKFYDLFIGCFILLMADFVCGINGHIYILYNLICIPIWVYLFSLIEKNSIMNKSIRVLDWFGIYTLELYMIHLYIFNVLKLVVLPQVSNSILFPVAVIIAIAVCKPTHEIIDIVKTRIYALRANLK